MKIQFNEKKNEEGKNRNSDLDTLMAYSRHPQKDLYDHTPLQRHKSYKCEFTQTN